MTDEHMQLAEHEGEILIAVVDETYGVADEDRWEPDREAFRRSLEAEYDLPFGDGDIGPGASLPAFLTLLSGSATVPVWVLLSAAFLLGKPLHENLTAWRDMALKVRSFFKRPVFLNRQGAAVLAVEAVLDAAAQPPRMIRLVGHRTQHVTEEEDLAEVSTDGQIAVPVPTLYLGFVRHIFDIQTDDATYRVRVDGRSVEVVRLSS